MTCKHGKNRNKAKAYNLLISCLAKFLKTIYTSKNLSKNTYTGRTLNCKFRLVVQGASIKTTRVFYAGASVDTELETLDSKRTS